MGFNDSHGDFVRAHTPDLDGLGARLASGDQVDPIGEQHRAAQVRVALEFQELIAELLVVVIDLARSESEQLMGCIDVALLVQAMLETAQNVVDCRRHGLLLGRCCCEEWVFCE